MTFQIRQKNYPAPVGFLPEPDFCRIWKSAGFRPEPEPKSGTALMRSHWIHSKYTRQYSP